MVRQSDVKGAYSRVGDPSVRRWSSSSPSSSSSSGAGRWVVLFGFLAVAALFVSMGRSAGRAASGDGELSGQARHHPVAGPADSYGASDYYSTKAESSHGEDEEEDGPPPPSDYSADDSSAAGAGKAHGSAPSSSRTSGSASSAGRGEDDGYEDGSRTVNRPGSAAHTASEDGDSESSNDDDDDEGSHSKESDEDDDGDDRSDGADSPSESSGEDPVHEGSASSSPPRDVPDEDNPYEASSTDVEQEENHVVEDLRHAEAQEVKAEEAKAQSTLGRLGSGLRIGLGKLFGDKATDQEIEDIAVAVEAEVTAEVNQEIEVASEQILEDEVDKVRNRIQRLRDDGKSEESIAVGVAAEEDADVSELRHSVDEIEDRVEKSIKTRESMAEKKILEDKLSKKLGKKVKLTFVEQDERFDGMDEVMKQLPSLRGSPSPHKKRKKKTKSSSSSGERSNPEASPTEDSESQPSPDSEGEGDW